MENKQQEESRVYVIREDYRMVYSNDKSLPIRPESTDRRYCYEALYHRQEPCERCPMKEEYNGRVVVFEKHRNRYIGLNAVLVELPGIGKCHVITSSEIEKESACPGKGRENWLYNKKCFFMAAEEVIRNSAHESSWCIVSIDIENLKLLNGLYGRQVGDALIRDIFICLKEQQRKQFSLTGYFGNDDFALLMPFGMEQIEELYRQINRLLDEYGRKTGFFPVFGVYEIADRTEPAYMMYDRAELARMVAKSMGGTRIRVFDSGILEQYQLQYGLYSDIRRALKQREFTFYLQPKCNMQSGRIIGAEALVRWKNGEKGMVSPGLFVPFLERTGMITELDLYVWEAVCRWQREIIDRGMEPIPVSINVSRMDLYAMDVPGVFRELTGKYDLDPKLIEIEITESACTEENDRINYAITELRKSGFRILMDDFGSGYSSLNMLKDIEVDILKIDMRFLDINESNKSKGIYILETILNMADILGIGVIVEGVETERQKNTLLRLGSAYGQGYYFYRPLPQEEFENLIRYPQNVETGGVKNQNITRFSLKDLLSERIFSEKRLNTMFGPMAFYDVSKDRVKVTKYNEQYAELQSDLVLYSDMDMDFRENYEPEECRKIREIFEQARLDKENGASGILHRIRKDGSGMTLWLEVRIFLLKELETHAMFYCLASDICKNCGQHRCPDRKSKETKG